MKRKLFSVLMAVLLLLQMPMMAFAEEGIATVNVRSAYWANDQVYVFSNFPETEDTEDTTVSLLYNNQLLGYDSPQSLSNTGATIHYMLLIDRSVPMDHYKSAIVTFVSAAMKAKTGLKFSVATFDKEYQLIDKELDTIAEVRSAIKTINYVRKDSDIGGGVAKALEYLGERSIEAGDISNLVVITDGKAWYSSNSATQQARNEEAAQNASAMMAAYPDVTVHTLCLDKWDETIGEVLSAGRGLHLTGKTSVAGQKLAEYSDGLYVAKFPLRINQSDAYLSGKMTFCVGMNMITLGSVRNITVDAVVEPAEPAETPPEPEEPPQEPVEPSLPIPPGAEPDPAEPAEGDPDPTEETEDPTGETTDPTEETVDPTEETEDPTTGTEMPVTPQNEGGSGGGEETIPESTGGSDIIEDPVTPKPKWVLPVIIAAVVLVVLLAALLLLKKSRAPAGSIRMSVQVVSGSVERLKKVYYLTDQILIGTDRRCHIVIDDPGAAPVNTRIFKKGQMIYIEDMDSPGGTLLGGMRMYSSNRLRSGDDITIGTVTLRVLF